MTRSGDRLSVMRLFLRRRYSHGHHTRMYECVCVRARVRGAQERKTRFKEIRGGEAGNHWTVLRRFDSIRLETGFFEEGVEKDWQGSG